MTRELLHWFLFAIPLGAVCLLAFYWALHGGPGERRR